MITIFVAAWAAAAAWLSQGALAFTAPGADRIGLLPVSSLAFGVLALAAMAIALLAWRRATALPVLLLGLIIVPWLPLQVPASFLLWSGPAGAIVWLGVVLALVWSAPVPWAAVRQHVTRRPAASAMALAFAIYGFAAWQVSPSRPVGDEPHYLIITQSLLYDHDLKIENNHRRGDYRAYFAGELRPDYLRRGRNGEIYSIHAPGTSALVLPAFALGGYRAVVLFLILLSSIAAGLAWHLTFRVTGRRDAAWFGWAAVVLAPTVTLNAFTVYPDAPGALLVLTGVWALVRARDERTNLTTRVGPWLWHGAALAVLPWLHTRFALLAGGIGALVLLRLSWTRNPVGKACAFLAIPTASALAWIGFFVAIYGAPDPSIPYGGSDLGSPSYVLSGLAGLLFDQQYGLFVYAPVLAAAVAGLVVLARRGEFRWLPIELMFIAVPYLLVVTHFAMWWAGLSAPARFALPLVPVLAIPAGAAWAAATRRGTRVMLLTMLAVTGFVCAMLVTANGGRLAYHDRDVYARWLQWLSRTADLQHALPSFFAHQRVFGRARAIDAVFYVEIVVWVALAIGTWLLVRAADSGAMLRGRSRLATATGAALAMAGMAACSMVWRLERVDGASPVVAGAEFLRVAGAGDRLVSVDVSRARQIALADLLPRFVLQMDAARLSPQTPRDDRPIFALPPLPAGDYRMTIDRRGGPGGWLMVGIGRDQFAIVTQPADAFAGEVPLRFPVDVRAIVVRGDEDGRRSAGALRLRPVSLLTRAQKASAARALHAVRYGAATVYFMDDRSYPEPNGFWSGGSCASSIVLQPDRPRSSVRIRVRNAPVENQLDVEVGEWKTSTTLAPGDERSIDVPLDSVRGATLITLTPSAGFWPSALDPQSRDARFLGVWVKIE